MPPDRPAPSPHGTGAGDHPHERLAFGRVVRGGLGILERTGHDTDQRVALRWVPRGRLSVLGGHVTTRTSSHGSSSSGTGHVATRSSGGGGDGGDGGGNGD